MINEKTKAPIDLVYGLLAEMTDRATEAERKRDNAMEAADGWHMSWKQKVRQCKELEVKLAAEIEEHKRTREVLREVMEVSKMKGASSNDGNKSE